MPAFGEDHVDLEIPFLDRFIETVEISQVRHIALYAGYVLAYLCDCAVQRVLAAAGDEYVIHSLFNEALWRCQAHAR
jgi:hypothetical protein